MSAERTPFSATTATTTRSQSAASGARADIRFSNENSLVDTDASLRLPVIARLCRERGYLFPLARPLPWLTLADACRRFPFLVDAYVSSVDALTEQGLPLSTGKAPRAATGPDLLGVLCSRPPLATATRVRLRVLDAKSARVSVERFATGSLAVERVLSLLEEARAFAVVSFRAEGDFVVAAVGGPAAIPFGEPMPRHGFGDVGAPAIGSARSVVPGDCGALLAALQSGSRVVAAPFMGRAATISPVATTPSLDGGALDGGAATFADALVRAAGAGNG